MTAWNISAGANASFTAQGNPDTSGEVGGSLRNAGNIADANLASNVSLGEAQPIITIVSGTTMFNTGILGAGTFNNNAQDTIVRVSTDLAGVANNAVRFGASDSANNSDSPHTIGVLGSRLLKTALVAGQWNEVAGTWSSDPTVDNSGYWSIEDSADTSDTAKASGTDHEAAALKFTNRGPGEFAYHYGSGGGPTTDEYPTTYLW